MQPLYHSIQFKVSLNATFVVYQIVQLLRVSILQPDYRQACIEAMPIPM
jgi:hypothetical protein